MRMRGLEPPQSFRHTDLSQFRSVSLGESVVTCFIAVVAGPAAGWHRGAMGAKCLPERIEEIVFRRLQLAKLDQAAQHRRTLRRSWQAGSWLSAG
jgi:hypothetical protein